MKRFSFVFLAVGLLAATGFAQNSPQSTVPSPQPAEAPAPPANSGSFFQSVTGYFTSFNTNLDGTFLQEHGSIWTGVDSIQGGPVPLANSIGLSYDLYRPTNSAVRISVENVLRNSGVAGTVLSEGMGLGMSWVVHDTKLTAYLDGVYGVGGEAANAKFMDRLNAEIGLRVQKALTDHTFAGVGFAVQLPSNRQVLSATVGFTF